MTRGNGPSARVAALLITSFFLVFLGPAVVQVYLKNLLRGDGTGAKATLILAVLYFSFMFWRLLVVKTQRVLGDRLCLILGVAGYLLVPVALVFTADFWVLAAAAAAWGWAAAAIWQTGPLWLYDHTDPRRRGFWAGALYAALFLGLWCGTLAVGRAADAKREDLMLWFLIVPGVPAVVLCTILPARPSRAEALSLAGIRTMLFDRGVAVIGILLFISATTYGLLLGAFRNGIDAAYGAGTVGKVLSNFFAARLLVSVAAGHFSDVIARRTVVAAVFAVGGLALALASIYRGVWALSAAAAALGIVGGTVPVSATAYSADWFPPEKRPLALGAAFFWNDAGTATALLAGQWLSSLGSGFFSATSAFALLFLASAVLSLLLPGMRTALVHESASNGK